MARPIRQPGSLALDRLTPGKVGFGIEVYRLAYPFTRWFRRSTTSLDAPGPRPGPSQSRNVVKYTVCKQLGDKAGYPGRVSEMPARTAQPSSEPANVAFVQEHTDVMVMPTGYMVPLTPMADNLVGHHPRAITADRVRAIRLKPPGEWTDDEREYMAAGLEWALEVVGSIPDRLRVVWEQILEAITEIGQVCSSILNHLEIDLDPGPGWPSPNQSSFDDYRDMPGIPGVSERCWADVWDGDLDNYTVCNAEAVTDIGLCEEHKLK